ncbi:MAG TPA: prepilin-type N-terminal cleavage/methylation domain-containing protein [Pyrinomonadaceae bacterium]|jgi:Tfp pilus assembly protein PilV|nr:prepilin-type N-terminal cleavage/methylation domain-containing protein [Pyrinomonadaceae bacterium]
MKSANARPDKGKTAEGTGLKSERGFTLIETVVSLVVMMIVGLGAASLFMYAVRNNSGAADRAVAIAIAQQRMERLRSVAYTDASLNVGTTNTTVVSSGRNYRVQTVICASAICSGSATIKKIIIQVTPTSAGTVWASNSVSVTARRASPIPGGFIQ